MLINMGWKVLGALLGLLAGIGMAFLWGDAILWAMGVNPSSANSIAIGLVMINVLAGLGAVIGLIMTFLPLRANLIIAAPLLAAVVVNLYINRYQYIERPPSVEPIGNFELLTYDLTNGTFYGLRYQGAPIEIEEQADFAGKGRRTYSRFETLITLEQPAVFIVHVGDQYQKFFYLVREVDGQLQTQRLSDDSAARVRWLDVDQADREQRDAFILGRRSFMGGRWLLLGENAVLDVQTLTAYPIDTQPIVGNYQNQFLQAGLLFSPDQRSFVTLATSDTNEYTPSGLPRTVAKLIVFDFVADSAYMLPITRPQMRYSYPERIDAAWIEHHFTWQQNEQGIEQLVERANFSPIPYHGEFVLDKVMMNTSYTLAPVKPELFETLIQFLEENYQAVQSGDLESDDTSKSLQLTLGEQQLSLYFTTYNLPAGELSLQVAEDQDNQLLKAIGQRFDEVLASGKYDELFLGDPGTN